MPLALGTAALLSLALLWTIAWPVLRELAPSALRSLYVRVRHLPEPALAEGYDPGRELRAEQRARALLRTCVNEEEWAMYSELGFLRVLGGTGAQPQAYLLYPHRPILSYEPESGAPLGEYCVDFPDLTRPYGSSRLPDADDVLAKWMALTAEECSLIARANMHLPGRQIDVERVRRDLVRLACWEREREREGAGAGAIVDRRALRDRAAVRTTVRTTGSVGAPVECFLLESVTARDRPSLRAGSVRGL